MMFRIDRIRWLPLALLMCLWNVDSLSAFFKTTSVPSTTASSTTITASTATRRGFFARSIYASYSHRLSRRHATSSSFEKDDEYVNIPEEWKQYVKTSSEERTKQFTDFEPSSTDMITTTGTTILTTPNGEISTKEAPNYLVDTDVNEKSGLEDEEEEANERMQVDALVDLYEELIGIINYMLDLYHTQELYNLPEKLMKKLEDRAYVLFIGNDIYQSSMTAALSQHPVGSKNYEGIRSVMEFIDEYLLFQQRSRLKYKLNYLILGAVIGKLDDAIMLLSER